MKLESLVRMKMTSFHRKDEVHLLGSFTCDTMARLAGAEATVMHDLLCNQGFQSGEGLSDKLRGTTGVDRGPH